MLHDVVETRQGIQLIDNETELENIARSRDYGILIFKADSVEKEIVEDLLSTILCSAKGNILVEDIRILDPINNPDDLRKIYPDLKGEIWKANVKLFKSNNSVAVLLKGNGFCDMWETSKEIKGKIIPDITLHGLREGIRGILPTIGEEKKFLEIKSKKENNIPLEQSGYDYLARNLIHTPDTYEERLATLEVIDKYSQNDNE